MNNNTCLLIYNHPIVASAPTIMDHVNSFNMYSVNDFININTNYGFPPILNSYKFDIIVLHYSLFGKYPFLLSKHFIDYIKDQSSSIKIAFFQDEHQYCLQRFNLINDLKISVIFSLLEEQNLDKVYGRCENVKYKFTTLTGYVSDELKSKSSLFTKPFNERSVDFGYRARDLSFVMGKGAQEKTNIAIKFAELCVGKKYKLDLSSSENSRLHGDEWYRFVANCKAMLGVEAGVSIFDINGEAFAECKSYLNVNPGCTFEEIYNAVLRKYELSDENVYYRTISPRVFEAAAFKVCMVMFEGSYSGLLQPYIHYIPLRKNFSNIEEVFDTFNNLDRCKSITENAYSHLIKKNVYTFNNFIKEFDSKIKLIGAKNIVLNQDFKPLDIALLKLHKKFSFKFKIKRILKKFLLK